MNKVENELVVAVEAPPSAARRSNWGPWEIILNTALQNPGTWLKVKRTYADKNAAIRSARQAATGMHGKQFADELEFAHIQNMFDEVGKWEIYLRWVRVERFAEAPAHQNPSMSEMENFFREADPADVENYVGYAMAEETE